MLQDIGIILTCCTLLFLLYKTEELDRKFSDLKGRMELVWRRYMNKNQQD